MRLFHKGYCQLMVLAKQLCNWIPSTSLAFGTGTSDQSIKDTEYLLMIFEEGMQSHFSPNKLKRWDFFQFPPDILASTSASGFRRLGKWVKLPRNNNSGTGVIETVNLLNYVSNLSTGLSSCNQIRIKYLLYMREDSHTILTEISQWYSQWDNTTYTTTKLWKLQHKQSSQI
jgi:hypothetical protein